MIQVERALGAVISTAVDRRSQPSWSIRSGAALLGAVLLLSGCVVPEHMEVRAGKDPQNLDDDVRFRTNYYFRVFDYCTALKGPQRGEYIQEREIIPETDALYRFKMTGKAFSLFTNVHFEAGTLKSWEIDPFGANVVFDEKNKRFRFKSRRQSEQEADRAAKQEELTRLIEQYRRLNDKKVPTALNAGLETLIKNKFEELSGTPSVSEGGSLREVTPVPYKAAVVAEAFGILFAEVKKLLPEEGSAELLTNQRGKIRSKLDEYKRAVKWEALANSVVDATKVGEFWRKSIEVITTGITNLEVISSKEGNKEVKADIISDLKSAKNDLIIAQAELLTGRQFSGVRGETPLNCVPGRVSRRGFQILGPEGWRTFDQDERLVLAMASSGKPLISAMKKLSGRVLQEKSNPAGAFKLLVAEADRVSSARNGVYIAAVKPKEVVELEKRNAIAGQLRVLTVNADTNATLAEQKADAAMALALNEATRNDAKTEAGEAKVRAMDIERWLGSASKKADELIALKAPAEIKVNADTDAKTAIREARRAESLAAQTSEDSEANRANLKMVQEAARVARDAATAVGRKTEDAIKEIDKYIAGNIGKIKAAYIAQHRNMIKSVLTEIDISKEAGNKNDS